MNNSGYNQEAGGMPGSRFTDMGARDKRQINENEIKYQLVFKHAPIGLMYFDRFGMLTSCNQAFEAMMGSSLEALTGLDLLKLSDKRIVRLVENVLQGESSTTEGRYTSDTGHKTILVKMNLQPIIDNEGVVIGGVGILEDITKNSEYERRLRYLSQRDSITGLFNRSHFEQQLEALNASLFKAHIAIIMCDIDNLKLINDTMGHLTGDRLLKAAADIISGSCSPDAVTARIGGDEFAVLIPAGSLEYMERFKQQLQENMAAHNSAHPDMPVSVSWGYAISEEDQTDLKVLMREADLSMYQQKITGHQKSREHIAQRFLQRFKNPDAATAARNRRLKEQLRIFGGALDLSEVVLNHILSLADYHDIGKIGIENQADFARLQESQLLELDIKKHCETGFRIALASDDTAVLSNAILKHHECWDGSGYPLGLKGEEIPLECRIFAVIDAYDEIINQPGDMADEQVIKALQDMAGIRLDPRLTRVFIDLIRSGIIKTDQE